MLRIAVCDDNIEILSFVSDKIKEEMERNKIKFTLSSFSNGTDLLKEHGKNPFTIAFLDICIPDINGFSISKLMAEKTENLFVIFITSNEELVYDCFDYRPFNFIRKGSPEMLSKNIFEVVKKLIRHVRESEAIHIDTGYGESRTALVSDILYLRSDGHYLEYLLSGGECIRSRESISGVAEKMSGYNFLRIHRRYLVNMKYIRNIDVHNDEVILTNGAGLDIGRSYKDSAVEIYKKYMRTLI